MPLTINTNSAAASANYNLSRNQSALQKSLTRLSSGSRIVQPIDDAGGLAVSMKLESAIVRLDGAQKNVQNATSFLEVQDGVLASAGKILNRMIELKGLSDDVMKNASDTENSAGDAGTGVLDAARATRAAARRSLCAERGADSSRGDASVVPAADEASACSAAPPAPAEAPVRPDDFLDFRPVLIKGSGKFLANF